MEHQPMISWIVNTLQQVPGVKAIVLGGSRARGTHTPDSDVDIGLYYDPAVPLDLPALQQAARQLDDAARENLVTETGGWGPWINGGGWLTVQSRPVDLLYRDLNKVAQVMEQCLAGQVTIDYQPGHPHGFINAIYFSEIALCQILWDPSDSITALKKMTLSYPPLLQKAMIGKFFWEASFALEQCKKGMLKQDAVYMAGCGFRALSCLNLVLFAINECYWMNEKGAAAIAGTLDKAPGQYKSRANRIASFINEERQSSEQACRMLQELIQETETLLRKEGLA